jgi:putative membrane protein
MDHFAFTFKKFQFTFLTYSLIIVHCYVLFIGGHYTYAQVPLFDWIKEAFDQNRNNYDKVGHFTQGFVPAIIARELFIRHAVVKPGGWLTFLTVCTCLSISVFYEFLEWFVAEASGQSAEAFLGTQGYVWDTQSDMLYAGIGAACAILLLGKFQNNLIRNIQPS